MVIQPHKVDIIRRKDADIKLSDEKLAVEFGVECFTISGILRNKEKFLQLYADAKSSDLKKTRIQMARFYSLEETLYKWFESLRSQNIPVSQDLLKIKAVELYNKAIEQGTQFSNFKASNRWLEKFQNRYNIHCKIITGESESICLNQVENERKELQQIIATFNIDDVYNADETGLFFHLGPNKTLASKGDKAKDGLSLGLKNLQIKFLPANMTAYIQPCDTGIIRNFKVYYRKILVSQWIHELNEGQEMKKPNIKEVIEIVADAWDNVKQETIKNCWLSTGILTAKMTHANTGNMKTDEADNDIVKLISALDSLSIAEPSIDNLTANEYIEIDNNLVSAELSTDDELIEEILLAEGVLHLTQVNMEDSNEEEEASISVKVGREVLVTARKFLEQREFTTESDIRYIRNIIKCLDKTLYSNLRYTPKNFRSQSGDINE
ncbi:4743_t:CDS:2, partial [Acaulospora morrowiae]